VTPTSPAEYDAWYYTDRGRWIGETELRLMMRMLSPAPGETLLDVGSGTGYFTRGFAAAGLAAVGLDRELGWVTYARERSPTIPVLIGDVTAIPARDASFDYVVAVTSLCFVDEPARALGEMWRVARRAVLLGLLNRHSLLYRRKRERGGYRGARWDTLGDVRAWAGRLSPSPRIAARSAVFVPSAGPVAQRVERFTPGSLLRGGFLAVCLHKDGE
jgi:SAM-dependent methyltransferase